MTMTSWPYVAQDTTDIEYGRLFREMAASDGMAGSFGDDTLRVTGDSSGRQVKMATGSAILRGYMFYSTAIETIAIAANSGAARVDLVVLELNLSAPLVANRILPKVLQGTSGSSTPPSLMQTETGIYQIPLATVAVANNAAVINAGDVVDARSWMDQKYGVWTTSRRPVSPRKYKLGFNETMNRWEYYNGSSWVGLTDHSHDLGSGSITGILPTWKGGTGASDPSTARAVLGAAASSHIHDIADVLQDGKPIMSSYLPNTYAPKYHTHDTGDLASGILSMSRGGTGQNSRDGVRQNTVDIWVQPNQPAYAAGRIWIKTA